MRRQVDLPAERDANVSGTRLQLRWDDRVAVPTQVTLRSADRSVPLLEEAPGVWACIAPEPLPGGAVIGIEIGNGPRCEIVATQRSLRVPPWAGFVRAALVGPASGAPWNVSFEPIAADRIEAIVERPLDVRGGRGVVFCAAKNFVTVPAGSTVSCIGALGDAWAVNASCPGWVVEPRHSRVHCPETTTVAARRPQSCIRVHAPDGAQVVLYLGDLSRPLVHVAATRVAGAVAEFFTLGDGSTLPADREGRAVVAFPSGALGGFDLRTDAAGNAEVFAREAGARSAWRADWNDADVATVFVLHGTQWSEAQPRVQVADAGHRFADCWQVVGGALVIASLDEQVARCLAVAADGRVGAIDRPSGGSAPVRWLPGRAARLAVQDLGAVSAVVSWQLQAEFSGQWLSLLRGRSTLGELAERPTHALEGVAMRLLTRRRGEKGREVRAPFR